MTKSVKVKLLIALKLILLEKINGDLVYFRMNKIKKPKINLNSLFFRSITSLDFRSPVKKKIWFYK